MGTMVGHVGLGLGFFAVGLWHLVNHIRLHCKNSRSYASLPWFPSSVISRHLELYLIIIGSCISIAMELFIGPQNHQPLDPSDWSIPSNHLHNFEHASICLSFVSYAAFALVLDRTKPSPAYVHAQELLMLHLHSTDHTSVEGQYHWLLQLVIAVSLLTTLMGIGYGRSFAVGFVRSASIVFQGVWLVVMGVMLWTPGFIPKGCFMNDEDGHWVVRCHNDAALRRAKSMVNIEFSWYLVGTVALVTGVYLFMARRWYPYSDVPEYVPLSRETTSASSTTSEKGDDNEETDDTTGDVDVESQRNKVKLAVVRGFFPHGFGRVRREQHDDHRMQHANRHVT